MRDVEHVPSAVLAAIADYEQRLRARFGARLCELRLYGSYARDEAHAGSDVDLLVLVEGLDDDERRWAAGATWDVAMAHDLLQISPLLHAPESWAERLARERAFHLEVEREAVRL